MSDKNTESTDFWTDKAHNDRLAIGKGILGIGTECYGLVNGEIDILNSMNSLVDTLSFDHIVEGGIEIGSGELEVLDCPNFNKELVVTLKPGSYRMRVYSSNLASVKDDGGDDYYKIELWPDTNMDRNVLKRYVRK